MISIVLVFVGFLLVCLAKDIARSWRQKYHRVREENRILHETFMGLIRQGVTQQDIWRAYSNARSELR